MRANPRAVPNRQDVFHTSVHSHHRYYVLRRGLSTQSGTSPPLSISGEVALRDRIHDDSVSRRGLEACHRSKLCFASPHRYSVLPEAWRDHKTTREAQPMKRAVDSSFSSDSGLPNVVFSCELTWRGPCESTGRDKADRQLQNCVSQVASSVPSRSQLDRSISFRDN